MQDGETTTEIEPEGESHTTVDSAILQEGDRERSSDELDDAANVEALLSDPSSELTPQIRAAIKAKWQKIVGPDTEIVVCKYSIIETLTIHLSILWNLNRLKKFRKKISTKILSITILWEVKFLR